MNILPPLSHKTSSEHSALIMHIPLACITHMHSTMGFHDSTPYELRQHCYVDWGGVKPYSIVLRSVVRSELHMYRPTSHEKASKYMQGIQSARLSLQSSELASPPPHPQASVALPSFGSKGGDTFIHSLEGEGAPFGRRDRHSGTLGIV